MSREIPVPQAHRVSTVAPDVVTFTAAQLAWMDKNFPEPVYSVGTDEKRFLEQSIRRGVVHEMRRLLAKSQGGV